MHQPTTVSCDGSSASARRTRGRVPGIHLVAPQRWFSEAVALSSETFLEKRESFEYSPGVLSLSSFCSSGIA